MWFFRDIVFPIVIFFVVLALIVYILNLVLKIFNFDIPIVRFAGLFVIWYYIGPILYNLLTTKIIVVQREGIRILYMPIQAIIEAFEKIM